MNTSDREFTLESEREYKKHYDAMMAAAREESLVLETVTWLLDWVECEVATRAEHAMYRKNPMIAGNFDSLKKFLSEQRQWIASDAIDAMLGAKS